MGILQGSRLLEWMDIAAAICAQTHTGTICVTAAVYKADFINSAQVGNIISIQANITRTFNTSMEIFVQAHARPVVEGKPSLISEAFFCFVALDHQVKKTTVNPLITRTKKEKEAFQTAEKRRHYMANFPLK